MSEYYTYTTTIGQAKLAAAIHSGGLVFTEMAFGDSMGESGITIPAESMTSLVNEHPSSRIPLADISNDPDNANWINFLANIPTDVGGWLIREVGIFDEDGDMIFIGRTPDIPKPVISQGSSAVTEFEIIAQVTNIASVNISVDPNIIHAKKSELIAERKLKTKIIQDDYIISDADNGYHLLLDMQTEGKTVTVPEGLCDDINFVLENISADYDVQILGGLLVSFGKVSKPFMLRKGKDELAQFLWRSANKYKVTGDAMGVLSALSSTQGSELNLSLFGVKKIYPSSALHQLSLDSSEGLGYFGEQDSSYGDDAVDVFDSHVTRIGQGIVTNGVDTIAAFDNGRKELHIAVKENGSWSWTQSMPEPFVNDKWGSQHLAMEGNVLAVSASYADGTGSNRGEVYIYRRLDSASDYILEDTVSGIADGNRLGNSAGIDLDGDNLFAFDDANDLRHYVHSGGTWTYQGSLGNINGSYNTGEKTLHVNRIEGVLTVTRYGTIHKAVRTGGVWGTLSSTLQTGIGYPLDVTNMAVVEQARRSVQGTNKLTLCPYTGNPPLNLENSVERFLNS